MKQFFHDLFYLPKHEQLTDRSFMKIIISSIAGITLCCLCLMSLTWAWFEDNTVSSGNSITSASFWSEVEIQKVPASSQHTLSNDETEQNDENQLAEQAEGNDDGELSAQGGLSDNLEGKTDFAVFASTSVNLTPAVQANTIVTPITEIDGSSYDLTNAFGFKLVDSCQLKNFVAGEYKFTVRPQGTSQKVGGYIVIKAITTDANGSLFTEEKLYTEQLMVNDIFVFTIEIEAGVDYSISCVWGSLPKDIEDDKIIENELDDEKSEKSSNTSSIVNEVTSSTVSEVTESSETAESLGEVSIENETVSSTENNE